MNENAVSTKTPVLPANMAGSPAGAEPARDARGRSVQPVQTPHRFWNKERVLFVVYLGIIIAGSLLVHLFSQGWHLFNPDHVPTNHTASLAFQAFAIVLTAFISLGVTLIVTNGDAGFIFFLPNVLGGLIALVSGLAGIPIESWLEPGTNLSRFREFEVFFVVFATAIQLAIFIQDNRYVFDREE